MHRVLGYLIIDAPNALQEAQLIGGVLGYLGVFCFLVAASGALGLPILGLVLLQQLVLLVEPMRIVLGLILLIHRLILESSFLAVQLLMRRVIH